MQCENSFPDGLTNRLYVHESCDTFLLTTGKRGIKGSLCGPIRPRTDEAARRVDTHSAGMRTQAALCKVQSPKWRK